MPDRPCIIVKNIPVKLRKQFEPILVEMLHCYEGTDFNLYANPLKSLLGMAKKTLSLTDIIGVRFCAVKLV